MADTVVGVATNLVTVPGGPPVTAIQDVAGNYHQTVVMETQAPGADPVVVGSANPLPIILAAGGAASGVAGTPSADVISVQGEAGMTPVQVSDSLTAAVGASYSNEIAPATPAVVTAKAAAGNVSQVIGFNLNSTPVYLKFWDTSSAPTLGTTAATYQFMIPGNTGGAGFVIPLKGPRPHTHAIYYAVTNGMALTDNTAIAANSVIADVSFI